MSAILDVSQPLQLYSNKQTLSKRHGTSHWRQVPMFPYRLSRPCHADGLLQLIAAHGASEEGKAYIESHPFALDRGTTTGRVAVERRPIHIPDVLADPEYS